eukprot:scaffold5595_cov71-Skeletonema_dohrnii-CCMP3373.AAC.3
MDLSELQPGHSGSSVTFCHENKYKPVTKVLLDRGTCQTYVEQGVGVGDATGFWKLVYVNMLLTLTDLLIAWVILILFVLMKNARQCLEEEKAEKGSELEEQIIIIVPSYTYIVALQVPRNLGLGEFSPSLAPSR